MNQNKLGSFDRFGYSWERFSKITSDQLNQFEGWTALIPKASWAGKSVLDVGCGAGRNSYCILINGAESCTSIDLDDRSLSKAKANLSVFNNSTIINLSIYESTFINKFDIAVCIGVLHHLSNPKFALQKMHQAVKEGGTVLIWVYGCDNLNWYIKILNPLRKYLFSRLPLPIVYFLAYIPSSILYFYTRLVNPKIGYLKNLKSYKFNHIHHILFDQMIPIIANYWTGNEVINLLEDCGLSNIKMINVNDVSWCAMGTKDN
jgi:SAM-dependent methyltransferase